MALTTSPRTEERIGVPAGRLTWRREENDLVARDYRIRFLGPGHWETSRRGRVLYVDRRRSRALAAAEHHHREVLRVRRITLSGLSAGAALVAAAVAAHWMSTLFGFLVFAAAVGVFVGSVARCVAATSRNILDPYRIREPWESSDWWSQ